jgi:hypothetical protein
MGGDVMSVFLAVDGKPVPIEDCSWYYYAPCGCCYGATIAQSGGRVLATEEDAWRDFWSRSDQRRKKQAAGYRFEIGLLADAQKLLSGQCAHKVRKS